MHPRQSVLVLILILLWPLPGFAAPTDSLEVVEARFAPLLASLLKPEAARGEQQALFLDKGSQDGVRAGDLFAVPGEPRRITHPGTGEVIEVATRPAAVLGVTQVLPQLAQVRVLAGDGGKLEAGMGVRRFEGLAATFVDAAGNGEAVYQALRERLPWFRWQAYLGPQAAPDSAPDTGLRFVLAAGDLNVRFREDWLVASFPDVDLAPAGPRQSGPVAPVDSRPAGDSLEPRQLAETDFKARSADFTAAGDRLQLALASRDRLRILGGSLQGLKEGVTGSIPHGNQVLAVRWWEPEGVAPLLAVTTWSGAAIEGMILRPGPEGLEPVALQLPLSLGVLDRNGDGRRETLLGQPFHRERPFGDGIEEIRLTAGDVERHDAGGQYPADYRVVTGILADITGGPEKEAIQLEGQRLRVLDAQGATLARPEGRFGSGLSILSYEVSPEMEFSPTRQLHFDPAPLAQGGKGVLVPVAEFSMFSLAGIDSGARRNQLARLTLGAAGPVLEPLGPAWPGPLLAFTRIDGQLLVAVQGEDSKSRILQLESATP